MYEAGYAIGYIVGLAFWAGLNYFAAHKAIECNEGIKVNPILYSLGALAFGGIYTLIFLGCKVLWFRHKQTKKQEEINEVSEELDLLQKRLKELESQVKNDNEQ